MVSKGNTAGLRLAAFLVVTALAAAACGGDDGDSGSDNGGDGGDGGGAQSVEVTAADFAFDPVTIQAEPGQEVEVTLVNDDSTDHTFTVEELDVEAQAAGGESVSVTFTAPDLGSVEFFCQFHAEQMRGEITVGDAASSSGESDSGGRGGYDLDE